jgi:hypothetical protein
MTEEKILTIRGTAPSNTAELYLEMGGDDVNLMCNGRLIAWVEPDGYVHIFQPAADASVLAKVDLGSSNQATEKP